MESTFAKNIFFNKNSSVFIATFSVYEKGRRLPKNGMVEPMISFFVPKVKTLLLLDQPHPISDTINPFIERYENGKLFKKYRLSAIFYFPVYLYCTMERTGLTRISYKLRDFFSVIFIAVTQKEQFNLFIGLESINTLAGIILRKLGKVEIVVYYVSDYSPNRFSKFGKRFMNTIYLWLDRFCVKHADFTWDVSSAIQDGRLKNGLDPQKKYNVIHVPNGLFPSQIRSVPISERTHNSLIYLGTLEPDFGVELAIEAFREVKIKIPKAILRIIGGGKELPSLKRLAQKLKLENSVIFYGFVEDNDEVARIVRTSYIGLAPYRAFPESIRWYGDAGKIRQYMASGLPVVTTQVPPLGRYIVEQGAGIMTKDIIKDFSDGIVRLLLDHVLYAKLTSVAEKINRDNTWENVYIKAFRDMKKIGNSRL